MISRLTNRLLWLHLAAGQFILAQNTPSSLLRWRDDLISWYRASADPSHATELILFPTPLPLDPSLVGPDESAALRSLLLLTDTVPDPALVYSTSGRRTADVYKLILENRALEVRKLSRSETRAIRKANRVLLKYQSLLSRFWFWYLYGAAPPPEYSRRYATYVRYLKKVAALRTEAMREPDVWRRTELLNQAAVAEKEWTDRGDKAEVERALGVLRASRAKDPETFWAQAVSMFAANLRLIDGTSLPVTQVVPPSARWADDVGWRSWHFGDSSGLVKGIEIDRNWLNLDVLTKHPWSWADGPFRHERLLISDGTGLATERPGSELMPLLPVQIFLAKNNLSGGHPMSAANPVIAGVACRILPKLPTF